MSILIQDLRKLCVNSVAIHEKNLRRKEMKETCILLFA